MATRGNSILHHFNTEKTAQIARINEYRMLFAKLGLNYDQDVPQKIKEQLELDKNSKQILINLAKKFEDGEFNK